MSISAVQSQSSIAVSQMQSQAATKQTAKTSTAKTDGDADHGVEPGKGQHINTLG